MALPTLNSSTYSITVPSTGNKVKFRPYLVKEEKILLVALESEDATQIVQAMRDVIEACVEDINTSELTSFDIEYLFLVLRAKSVGESIDLKMKCQNSESCSHVLELSINIDNIEVPNVQEDSKTIALTGDAGVVLRYPSIDTIQSIEDTNSEIDKMLDMIASSIVSVYDADNVYDARDESKESIIDFLNSLNSMQFQLITDFFENIPALEHRVSQECSSCGHLNEFELKGLQSFFT